MNDETRLELLRLALQHSDGSIEKALTFAKEMAKFVEGAFTPTIGLQPAPSVNFADLIRQPGTTLTDDPDPTSKPKRKYWNSYEIALAAELFDEGHHTSEIDRRLGRREGSTTSAISSGTVKPSTYVKSDIRSLGVQLARLK